MSQNASIDAQVRAAFQLLQQGRADAAEAACRRLLAAHPKAAWAAALLGHLLRVRGDYDAATAQLELARRLDPRISPPYCDLALIRAARGERDAALALVQRARELAPQDPNVYFALGQVLDAAQRVDDAERAYATAERYAPGFVAARYDLGVAAFGAQRFNDAVRHFLAVAGAQPQRLNAWVNLGLAQLRAGNAGAAVQALERACAIAQADGEVVAHYANALATLGTQPDAAADAYRRAVALQPDDTPLALRCIAALTVAGQYTALRQELERLLAREPDNLMAHWVRTQKPPTDVWLDAAQRSAWLAEWRAGMADIERRVAGEVAPADAAAILESVTNFDLAYLGLPLVEEQRRQAHVIRRLAEHAHLVRHEIAPRAITRARRRIGVLSHHLYTHSVHKALAEALLALPRDEFELVVYYSGAATDAATARWRDRADEFHQFTLRADAWAQRLSAADLDVLVYLDLGMNPLPQALAALRLAPVQVAGWGHPITTGSDRIDFYLSAQDTEPDGADAHYVERLQRLPNLGTCYARPELPAAAFRDTPAPVLAFAQHPAKLHPQHDALFARILASAPQARLDIVLSASERIVAQVRERQRAAFAAAGVDVSRVTYTGRLPAAEFAARMAGVDMLLDSLDFSGGITSIETLGQGVPVLTVPGACMRGRQTAAMLRRIDAAELIAADADDYVARAVRLATDAAWRRELQTRIAANAHRLYDDRSVCSALADFLRRVQPA